MDSRTIGSLIEDGVIEATTGFPFGGHNEHGIGIPHIRPFNVGTDGEIHLDQIKSIPEEASRGQPRLHRNDIVFNNTNTQELVGKCALWVSESEAVFSNHMTRIRVVDEACNPAYLSFAILHHWMTGRSKMLARAHVAQASIIGARFHEIDMPWLPLRDQRVIANLLGLLRTACRSQRKQIKTAQDLKRVVMRDLFARGLRGEPRKETEIGPIPQSWNLFPLGSLGKIGNGSTPKKSTAAYWEGGTFPWLTSAKVYDREVYTADQFVTERALDECHLPVVHPGAVLVAITGQGKTLGHCAVLRTKATINQHLAYIQTDLETAMPELVRGYLETQYESLRQVASGGGSTKGALTCAFLRDLPIPVPHKEEQRELVSILDAVDRKVELHQRKFVVLEDLFKMLLQKLMTGEIGARDVNLSSLEQTKLGQ